MDSRIESGKATDFYTWLASVSRDHYQTLLANECFDWDSLEDMDGDALQDMRILHENDRASILSKIESLKVSNADSGKASAFYDWLHNTYPDGLLASALIAQGYTSWEVLSSLNRQVLREAGTTKVGVQQKILKQIKKLAAQENDGPEEKDPEEGRPGNPPRAHSGPRQKVGLVLLGETGAGKSTFFQSLMDYARGAPFSQIRDTERNPDVKETESQTKKSDRFIAYGPDYVLHIVDTPGIGDTVGIDEDRRHIDNITRFLSQDCDFNAICMIIKNGQNRATHRMAYIISEIKANLTTDVWPQVFTVVTRCASNRFPGDDTCSVIEKLGLPGPETDRFFLVDNYAYERVDERRRPPKYLQAKQRAYDEAGEQLEQIIRAARALPMRNGQRIGELRSRRERCRALAKDMEVELRNIQAKEVSLRETNALLTRSRSEADLNRNFTAQQPREKTEKIFYANDGKATICFRCDNRCHDPCYLPKFGDVTGCHCIGSNGNCRYCGHHGIDHHKHVDFYYKTTTVYDSVVNEEVKRRFQNASSTAEKQRILKLSIERDLGRMQQTRERLTRNIAQIYVEIDTMAVESFNEFFPKYIEELKADLDNKRINPSEKRRRIAAFDLQIQQYNEIKRMYKQTRR